MNNSLIILLVGILFAAGAVVSAWAGIRSIQSARTVVFYRTRQARMLAGWQWLAASLALAFFAVASVVFRESLVNQILSPTAAPTSGITSPAGPPTVTLPASQTSTRPASATVTLTSSATVPVTPSLTPTPDSALATSIALTERRSTFIAALSATWTPTRTPIPTWTRTPTDPPPPTWTASLTPTTRPTRTPTFTLTPTRTPTRTPTSTRTPTPTRTSTPAP